MEKLSQPKDYSEETALAERVARIFGYDGLRIRIEEGGGWKTIRDEKSLTLVVDPTMLSPQTLKDAVGNSLPDDIEVPSQYAVYGVAHELGHVDDFMQPENDLETLKERTPAEHFFWNLLDDAVINKRLRNIPLLNNLTDEIYKDMLFPEDDYTKVPKHAQFMYGWLLRSVTPDREVTFSDDVAEALDSLEKVRVKFRSHNLYDVLCHPHTDFSMRRDVATKYIWPIYEKFLEEDEENQQDSDEQQDGGSGDGQGDSQSSSSGDSSGEGSSQAGEQSEDQDAQDGEGDGKQGFEEIYDAYKEASHCGHEEEDDEDDEDDTSGTHPHDAIKEAGEILREIQEEQEEENKQNSSSGGSQGEGGDGAGSIEAELELSPEDAQLYKELVEEYRQQIHEVAKVLQLLTVPSIEYLSPRYKKAAAVDGLKLSPRDLFRAVIASHSEEDPAIWRPVETVAKREGLSFNGLDIHLLIDASGSMRGSKAESAAACGVMLMEGVALARRMVERYNPQAPKPDVRLQTILFGSSAEVVSPLSHETLPKDKGIAFSTILEASSSSTYVSGALEETIDCAKKHPERTQLVYVITDGAFSDQSDANQKAKYKANNYFLSEYILNSPHSSPIVKNHVHLDDPTQLPKALNRQLHVVASKFFD